MNAESKNFWGFLGLITVVYMFFGGLENIQDFFNNKESSLMPIVVTILLFCIGGYIFIYKEFFKK